MKLPHARPLAVLLTALLATCTTDSGDPLGPEPDLPLQSAIVDDHFGGGVPGFFWLPTPPPHPDIFGGTFDRAFLSLDPAIDVCRIDGDAEPGLDACVGPVLISLTRTSPAFPENLQVDARSQSYFVWWNTADADVEVGMRYRGTLRAGNVVLGWVDVQVVRDRHDAGRVPAGFVPALKGYHFPFRFRVETGIVGRIEVAPRTATLPDASAGPPPTQAFTATVTDLYGVPLPGVDVAWASGDPSLVEVAGSGVPTGAAGETGATATVVGVVRADTDVEVAAAAGGARDAAVLTVQPAGPRGRAPVAAEDGYTVAAGGTLSVPAGAGPPDGLLVNDDLGDPPAAITSFGGGSLGGAVTDNVPGASVALAGGTLTLRGDGSLDLATPTTPGTYFVLYRLANAAGASDAPATIIVSAPAPAPPVAVDDARAVTGNVRINTANGGPFSVLDNDGGGAAAIVAFDAASANGGTVVMNTATGTFTYDPPAGFEGLDSFTYTLQNAGGSDSGTVVLTVADMIWFIDNSAAPGDGRLTAPFGSMAAFQAVNGGGGSTDPDAGDAVFVHTGTGTYASGVGLLDGQILVGQGASASIESVTGLVLAQHSDPLPLTGGLRPTLTSPGGDGIALAQNNTVRGLDVGATGGVGLANGGGSVGTLTVQEVSIGGTGGGVRLSAGGLLAVSLDGVTASAGNVGIDLANVSGSFAVTGFTDIDLSSGPGIEVTGSSGSFTFAAIDVDNTTTRGISLTGNPGASFSFAGATSVTTTTAPAFFATGLQTLTVSGAPSNLSSTTGTALTVAGSTIGIGGLTFESISANGAALGILLSNTGVQGGLTVTGDGTGVRNGSGGTIQNTIGDGVTLVNTMFTSLSQMTITNAGDDGIQSARGGFFTFTEVTIDAPGGHGWRATDLSGPNTVDDGLIADIPGSSHGVFVENASTNGALDITDTRFDDTGSSDPLGNVDGDDAIHFTGSGTSVMALNVGAVDGGSVFEGWWGNTIHAGGSGPADGVSMIVTVSGTVFQNAPVGGTSQLLLDPRGTGSITYDVDSNTFRSVGRNAFGTGGVIHVRCRESAMTSGRIRNNVVDGSDGLRGIDVFANQNCGQLDVEVAGNVIDDVIDEGLRVHLDAAGRTTAGITANVTVTNSLFGQTTLVGQGGQQGIEVRTFRGSGATASTMNLLLAGNSVRVDGSVAVDIDVENDDVMNTTLTNNSFVDLDLFGGQSLDVQSEKDAGAASSMCLVMTGNGANNLVQVEESLGTAFGIGNLATIVADNPGMVIGFLPNLGAFAPALPCATPTLP